VVGCGVVWCGVVWCGVVWCGVVWCGVVWCGVVWCGVPFDRIYREEYISWQDQDQNHRRSRFDTSFHLSADLFS